MVMCASREGKDLQTHVTSSTLVVKIKTKNTTCRAYENGNSVGRRQIIWVKNLNMKCSKCTIWVFTPRIVLFRSNARAIKFITSDIMGYTTKINSYVWYIDDSVSRKHYVSNLTHQSVRLPFYSEDAGQYMYDLWTVRVAVSRHSSSQLLL
jgi:hypothetical protein